MYPQQHAAAMCVWRRCVTSLLLLTVLSSCCRVCPVSGWVRLSPSDGSMLARRGHTAVTVGDRWLVVFGGRTVDVVVLTATAAATNATVSACWSIGGCHEEAAAGACNECGANSSVACACSCSTGFSGANCELSAVDEWLSSVSVWDMRSAAAGWSTVNADPAGTVSPAAWPAARYHHSAALLGSQAMYVYGGYSQLCGDFCSDLWRYDMAAVDDKGRGQWTQLLPADDNLYPGKYHNTRQHNTAQQTTSGHAQHIASLSAWLDSPA